MTFRPHRTAIAAVVAALVCVGCASWSESPLTSWIPAPSFAWLTGGSRKPGPLPTLEARVTPRIAWQQSVGSAAPGIAPSVSASAIYAAASDGTVVDLTAACAALRAWDTRANLDSRGVAVFREFALAGGIRFGDPFVPTDAVNTPRRLAVADPRVLTALADAVRKLAGVPLDAPLGTIQTEPRIEPGGSERIPIHGGRHESGAFNVINAQFSPGIGYPDITSGTSFVMAVWRKSWNLRSSIPADSRAAYQWPSKCSYGPGNSLGC